MENIPARYETFRRNLSRIRPYLPSSGRLLDVGTYCGVFLAVAEDFGFEATGVERSAWAVEYSREVLKKGVLEGTIHDLPSGAGHFDVITLWDVLEHLRDPWKELSAIHSRLKPNGVLALSTLNIDHWLPKLMGERWPWIMDMHLYYYFDRRILEQMLTKAGFQVIHSRSYCHLVTTDYLCLKLGAVGVWGSEYLRRLVAMTPMKRWLIPFRFGDIQLLVAKKGS